MEMRTNKSLSSGEKQPINADAGPVFGSRLWAGLSPELLVMIFERITSDELVRSVILVCKSWHDAVTGPYCSTAIDIEKWCRRCNHSDRIDIVVRKLVDRSRGMVKRFSGYKLGESGFSSVANCGRFLQELRVPVSDVTDKIVEKHAVSLTMLTVLDISYCLKITCRGLEALGKHCKSLVLLRRNMLPSELLEAAERRVPKTDNGEAMVIADTMRGLYQLELAYGRLGDPGLEAILTNCKSLTHLDIHGCWCVNFEGDLVDKCGRLAVFKSPWDNDYYDAYSSDSDNDGAVCGALSSCSDSEGYSFCPFMISP
ncbi:hypothetical protein NE237_023580 [Protea cynaroides]|uniref:F-box domain-containing protein n=1 Tax=Protea cynaroides TaxID=273540 RepID=A0A9Q0HEA1_9MAGN|nr:hypothetical protein NE237_023580 [Protea cynaroides]